MVRCTNYNGPGQTLHRHDQVRHGGSFGTLPRVQSRIPRHPYIPERGKHDSPEKVPWDSTPPAPQGGSLARPAYQPPATNRGQRKDRLSSNMSNLARHSTTHAAARTPRTVTYVWLPTTDNAHTNLTLPQSPPPPAAGRGGDSSGEPTTNIKDGQAVSLPAHLLDVLCRNQEGHRGDAASFPHHSHRHVGARQPKGNHVNDRCLYYGENSHLPPGRL